MCGMRSSSARHLATLKLLHSWYQKEKRDLPWRKNPLPYNVWVSEIMLQQTQVRTVIPYYERFLKRFPDFAALARADESEVLAHWTGLGYYSRARNMHRCAQKIAGDFGGRFPMDLETVKTLPGIGPYTAGAILSIAFNKAHPILDGNVRRILSRIYLEAGTEKLWEISAQLIAEAERGGLAPSDINQALMELGALVCLPSTPACGSCPVASRCLARRKGCQDLYPPARKKQEAVRKRFNMYLIAKGPGGKEFLLRRRSASERFLKNLWEFPMVEVVSGRDPDISEVLGAKVAVMRRLGAVTHSITHHRLNVDVLEAKISGGVRRPDGSLRWVPRYALPEYSSSSLLNKALALLN